MEKQNEKHTVIIPSYNTLEHLKNTYKSLKEHAPDVSIIIIDDASEDGTKKWLTELNDPLLLGISSKIRKGHTYWYDEGMRLAKTDIVSILHSDMIIGPNYFENMLKYLKKGTVVCATRIEPPIHPAGKEKIVKDFGSEANEILWDEFYSFVNKESKNQKGNTTKGIFAPWMLYKEDHLSIGGHDQRFTPFGYEDSDIFNRWILNGYKMIQSRDALCYHLTCRGHRWNKGVGIENSDYNEIMTRCRKDFIRKWGDWIANDEYQYPIINPKYNVGFIVKNCNIQLLELLEPWCDNIYIDNDRMKYITLEQQNTSYNLSERVLPYDDEKNNDILVEIDSKTFTSQDMGYISQFTKIISGDDELKEHLGGTFELSNMKITIMSLETYENDLIGTK
jgi:GT2 family glycosyltransferase